MNEALALCPSLGAAHDWWCERTFYAESNGPGFHPEQVDPLTIERMSRINGERCERWHGGDWRMHADPWDLADWSNAMQAEAGEAGNVVKKMRRIETGLWDSQLYPGDNEGQRHMAMLSSTDAWRELREKLGDELADTILYADLLAQKAGLNLADCIRAKFNRVSESQGFPERL